MVGRLALIVIVFKCACLLGQSDQQSTLRELSRDAYLTGNLPFIASDGQVSFETIDSSFTRLLKSPAATAFVEIVPFQLDELTELRKAYIQKGLAIVQSASPTINLERRQLLKDLRTEFEEKSRNVLLDHQRKMLEKYPSYVAVHDLGIVRLALAVGSSAEVPLSEKETDRIKFVATELRAKLIEKCKKIEEEIYDELSDELPARQKELLAEYRELNKQGREECPDLLKLSRQLNLNSDCQGCGTGTTVNTASDQTTRKVDSATSVLEKEK